jgi:hypothetical protein
VEQINNLKWILTKKAISSEEIASVEGEFGITFPQDYIECVREKNGGQPVPDTFEFVGNSGAVMNSLIPINLDEQRNVVNVYEKLKSRLPHSVYPFADDPFGNYLCFDYSKGEVPVIIFWDHEKAYSDRDAATSFVCNSFKELLIKLHD